MTTHTRKVLDCEKMKSSLAVFPSKDLSLLYCERRPVSGEDGKLFLMQP